MESPAPLLQRYNILRRKARNVKINDDMKQLTTVHHTAAPSGNVHRGFYKTCDGRV